MGILAWKVASESSMEAEFLELISDLFLSQHVSFPTRVREGQVPQFLNQPGIYNDENFYISPPLGKSDYIIISVDFQCYRNYKYNYGHDDYQSMSCELLNIGLTTMLYGLYIDTTWSLFQLQLIDKSVPTSLSNL